MAGLNDLTLGQIGTVGGITLGGLGAGAAYESMQDIKAINQMAKMGNYGPHNPMPQSFMDKLKGAYTPSNVFKKTGYPTGLKNWFFSRSSPEHFGPVEQTMKFAKNIPNYAMKGLGYLASLPAQAALMTLHSTPANADEIEWQNKMMQNQRIQLMNQRKQQMQETIRQAEAKAAAEAKAKADAAAAAAAAARRQQQQQTIAARGTAQGSGGTFVDRKTGAMKGYEKGAGGGKDAPSQHFYIARGGLAQRAPRYANGGLINFYRYGGFIG